MIISIVIIVLIYILYIEDGINSIMIINITIVCYRNINNVTYYYDGYRL